MNVSPRASFALAVALTLAACGGKTEDLSGTAAPGSSPSASSSPFPGAPPPPGAVTPTDPPLPTSPFTARVATTDVSILYPLPERGTAGLLGQWPAVRARQGEVLTLRDGPLEHRILITADTRRDAMTCAEERRWFLLYRQALDRVRPDVVFYYGGQPLDFLIAAEARARGIPVAF